MKLLKTYVIDSENIDLRGMLNELKEFKENIKDSISKGERTYLPNGNAKEVKAYKNPEQEQSVRGVLAWNILHPNNMIELPSKVSLLKLNIFDEEDILPLKESHPDIYNLIIEKIFNDESGMFVSKTWEPGIDYVNIKAKEWYKDIPKKFQAKYKKLGPEEWNHFVDQVTNDEAKEYDLKLVEKYKDDIGGKWIYKKRGMQVIAIPSNSDIPEWLQPYIDYSTMINNIIAPFIPVLEIFQSKTVEEGKTKKGVNRKTNAFTNIVKF